MRKEFGYERTTCDCQKCQAWCKHQPGFLVPSDLSRLIPSDADPYEWAEVHLRASLGFQMIFGTKRLTIPSLVPAKSLNGHCHWLKDGLCEVHEVAPFGCAFMDQHLSDAKAEEIANAGRQSRWSAFQADELYAKVWSHLWDKGLRYNSGLQDRSKALDEIAKISRQIERKRQNELRKSTRKQQAEKRRQKKQERRRKR